MTRILPCALALTTSGCFAASRDEPLAASGTDTFDNDSIGSDSFQDDDPPIGCQTVGCDGDGAMGDDAADDESSAPLAPVGSPCDGTNQCVDGAFCAAAFEDGEAGPLVCNATCIEVGDQAAWCSDDEACCSGLCGPRGLCEADGGSTSG